MVLSLGGGAGRSESRYGENANSGMNRTCLFGEGERMVLGASKFLFFRLSREYDTQYGVGNREVSNQLTENCTNEA